MPPYLVYLPLAGAVLGLIIGSFLATIIARWPDGQSVMKGRSRCDSCKKQLGVLDLIPVLSFVFHFGKCRYCGEKISTDHIAIELASALIGGLALFVEPGIGGLLGAIFGWVLLVLAILDARHHWLPNRLTLLLASTGLVSAFLVEYPDIYARIIGGVAGYLSLYFIARMYKVFRKRDGLGGGDPKLLGAIGCWLGWSALPLVLLSAGIVGLIAVFGMITRGRNIDGNSAVPLGLFMAIAAFPIWLMQNALGLVPSVLQTLL